MHSNKICCLIPALNEERKISDVIEASRKYIDTIIVVDDGSADSTSDCARRAGAFVIRHSRNIGKGMALRTGFAHVVKNGFDAVITLDADGQHNPSEIEKFVYAFYSNSGDIIIGARLWDRAAIPLYRYIPNKIGVFCVSRAARCKIEDSQTGFRLYRKEVLKKINLQTTGFETESEILIKAGRMGFRIFNIPVSAIYQDNYKTHFRPVMDFFRISMLILKLNFGGGVR